LKQASKSIWRSNRSNFKVELMYLEGKTIKKVFESFGVPFAKTAAI
jgi:hypothetical protein